MIWVVSLSTQDVITQSLTPGVRLGGIRSSVGVGKAPAPLAHSVALPPPVNVPRLYLNIFRGEPAIAEFDWPFTPIHRSSPNFSTLVGSVLHSALPELQPAHG